MTDDNQVVIKFTVRMDENTVRELDARADEFGQSRNALLNEISRAWLEARNPVVLGFFEVFGGEIGPRDLCEQCGYPIGDGGVWVAALGNGMTDGPFCTSCGRMG